ncbi:carbohydrate ABC transporter substrate-binding protein (CUT1 family) [Kineothrix alysoides]|uniref:Carbohydrate ABC transporter substrate-binding protein (CUT1 family) n=1 Tax=Kineothrix alysoides TaxID=1469948 RepID=A0A4R1R4Q6_9FIRM|nr:extracellular solute-binding protein [Kineothrix alysoides]TCL60390.1 carbohydrate ABC transporter substrate-binding protein (CUT1 family) [Kineothrix alysoides]
MKKVLAALIVGAGIFVMAGCSADSAKKAQVSAGELPVTLNVVTTFAGEDTNAGNYQEAIAKWQEETGNAINDASGTVTETLKARIISDFEMGSEPDVLFYFNGMDANPFVEGGKVISIDEIRAAYPDYASNMKDGMMGASPVDGRNYSVPMNGYWEGLFVNKEVCRAAGVKIPTSDTTWEEFMTICQAIKDAGYTPIAASFAEVPHYWFEFCIYNYLDTASHNILPKAIDDEQGTAWVNGIMDMKNLYDRGFLPANTLSATDGETFQLFVDGKAAFLIDGSWKVGGIEEATEDIDNFTVTYVPAKDKRKSTDIVGGLSSGWYITKKAWNDPEKQKACVDFITYMTSDEMVTKFASVATTALKEGTQVDKSKLSSLAVAGLEMVEGATGMASALQDQLTQEQRVPVFNSMADILTGKEEVKDAVVQLIDLVEEAQMQE